MNLLRCHVLGFGKLANLPLTFARGLNVVYAANEGGKSTLQRFIVALLYGQLRPDVKAQRRLESVGGIVQAVARRRLRRHALV